MPRKLRIEPDYKSHLSALTAGELYVLNTGPLTPPDNQVIDDDEWARQSIIAVDEDGAPTLLGSSQLEKAARNLMALTDKAGDKDFHAGSGSTSTLQTYLGESHRSNVGDGAQRTRRNRDLTSENGNVPMDIVPSRSPRGPTLDVAEAHRRTLNGSLKWHNLDTHSGTSSSYNGNHRPTSNLQVPSPSPSSSSTSVAASSSHQLKRPYSQSMTHPHSSASQNGDISKRRRSYQAYPDALPSSTTLSEMQSTNMIGTLVHNKPALLTPSQKKANHIQSEQKRRANIRRGYEALCATVPALREAIRIEEEAQRAAAIVEANESSARGKKKKRKQKDEAERTIDGRAGPKSENVVLQKTIDYITDLLSERASLLGRLNRARALLPNGHPALHHWGEEPPLWEREWTGGTGDDGDGEGFSDEEER